MKKYLLVTKISIQDTMQYRFDFVLRTLKYAGMVIIMSLVWIGVQKSGDNQIMTSDQTVRYFFLAAILYSLSNLHTWYIDEDIKLGYLSKFLLKPISPVWHYFSFESGAVILETLFKFLVILPILYLLGYSLNAGLGDFALLLLFMPIIFIFTFSLYSLISGLCFWFNDVFAIRWSLLIIIRFLSGVLVPISFFPQLFQQISFFLPFQHLAYTPIQMMNHELPKTTALMGLGILCGWVVVVTYLRDLLWRAGSKSYESTGI